MGFFPSVFSPFRFGNVQVKNRIEFSPSCSCLASPNGYVTRELIAYYQSIARGGAGIITIGETPVDFKYAKRHEYQLNLSDDKVINGLSVLVEAVERYGAKLSIELSHAGGALINRSKAIAPSPIPTTLEKMLAKKEGRRVTPVVEMDQDMIDKVIDNFASAAERCLRAGFQMVMIHGAHGHLIAQFLSPYYNKRTDHYGGSLENRARFAIELLTAIRKRIGSKLALEYRISASELIPEGMQVEDTIKFVKMIEDKIDLLHVSAGLLSEPETAPQIIQPTYFPHEFNVHYAEKLKKALDVPIATVGSIVDLEMADRIISEGKADIVAMARAIIADPEIVNKSRRGELDEIRPCLRCNVCTEYTRNELPIRCTVNPVIGREIDYSHIRPAKKKKRVVIIGGGPAGMEAALVASTRGHEVLLFERNDKLGGNLILAAGPPFKADMKRYLNWLSQKTLHDSNITVRFNIEATVKVVEAEEPDVIIVAVGAEPIIPDIPGVKRDNVVMAGDVFAGRVHAHMGDAVVVVGAGLTGCEAALLIAQQGKRVSIIDVLEHEQVFSDVPRGLMQLLQKHEVSFITDVKLEEITDRGVVVIDKAWERHEIVADTVVFATGLKPRGEIAAVFKNLTADVYVIGDACKPQNLKQAIHDGFNVAVEL